MRDGLDGAGAYHDIGLPRQNRRGQRRNIVGVVLVVGIGVDDHVRAQPQTGVQHGHEAARQPLVAGVAHEVIHAVGAGHRHRVVGAAIVDDQPFDRVETGHCAGQGGQRNAQGFGFVVTGDLDDEFHARLFGCVSNSDFLECMNLLFANGFVTVVVLQRVRKRFPR